MSEQYKLVIDSLRSIGAKSYSGYEKALFNAFQKNKPVQENSGFSKNYNNLAKNKVWFANSLIENARMEGYGSTQIWKFSNRLADPFFKEKVRRHSLDESRHSLIFTKMLQIVFPKALEDDELRAAVEGLYPGFTRINPPRDEMVDPGLILTGENALDELIQVHLTEIRAIVLQHLLKAAILSHTPAASQKKINKFMNSLIYDEARHINYTAEIFEDAINSGHGDFIYTTLADRQADLNILSYEELELDEVKI